MATSSIFHNVNVREKSLSKALITALERSKGIKSKEVYLSKKIEEVKGEDIRRLFGDN